MATAFLNERLNRINQEKAGQNNKPLSHISNLPTLLDIERTHVLFTNAHFKPFAAIGFEYAKVNITGGTATLGNKVTFSIPQFGDFFHDMCVHATMVQPTLTPSGSPARSDSPAMYWCAFPGERLLQLTEFLVNGNPLDDYSAHAYNMHREFRVSPNKLTGWKRCVGQEENELGYVSQPSWSESGVAVTSQTHRVAAEVAVGNQTPTTQKTANLEMFIPLLFWFNKDVRLAVPSVAIPYGQRFIRLTLATISQLVDVYPRGAGTWASPSGSVVETNPALSSIELYINNIFVNPEVHQIYIKRVGFSLIRVHREQTYTVTASSAEFLLQNLKWPIEYLMVGMKVKDYHDSSTAATVRQHLDKWHTFQSVSTQTYTTTGQNVMYEQDLVVNDAGTETLGIAATVLTEATPNTIAATLATLTGTGLLAVAVAVGDLIKINGVLLTAATAAAAGAAATGVTVYEVMSAITASTAIAGSAKKVTLQGLQVQTKRYANTVDTMTIKAHGIPIYNNYPQKFFNAYTSYHYGGPNFNTPEDSGLMFVPFCLYPGTYQPSGHINISRAREFYLTYTSSVIDNSTNGTLVVIAMAINFLLISDGSAVLRYST
jgi:hypothetical protein